MNRHLILASTSRYRRQLLERLGVPFRCCAPLVDEELLKEAGISPQSLAERLADAKATSLRAVEPGAVILGSDQVVACGERILGKPGTVTRAVAQLQELNGSEHQLITALCVWHGDRTWRHCDVTTMKMRTLTLDEINRYVASDQPVDCAGSYRLEARGIALFEAIQSADYTAIIGLPLIATTSILREIGFAIP